jgi:mono/diheme cytochrome c family protein
MSLNKRSASLASELVSGVNPILAVGSLALAALIIVGGPIAVVVAELSKPRELSFEEKRAALVAAMPALDLQSVARGKRFYNAACIACHAENARGVPKLGRDLVDGTYSRNVSDADFVAMIIRGRKQGDPGFTGPVAMPPRGGRDDYDDHAVRDIVAYVRALQEPTRIASATIPNVHVELLDGSSDSVATDSAPPSGTARSDASAAALPASFDPEVLKRGKRVYASCIACHAKDGGGVQGQGASLLDSAFVRSKSDAELREFIKTGRAPGAPGSRLNLNMPPKGGNPSLKDNQLDDVVVYIRHLIAEAEKSK